ncbi:ABC transporter permease [Clostridium sp. 'deep sea']|uniref:ABC transporter permease n=1 Tax=Clostridium sp. 'deep sea' TaxID=2779445 RepID=UPI0018967BD5|nr:ABC transporter permease [Clostridium sp. 'deep sea']QOR34782.1 ABC transporter permease [Clostridium sp. 'deep sea']
MLRYAMQRIVLIFITLFLIVTISFLTIRMMPGSFMNTDEMPDGMVKIVEEKYHLHEPLIVQYGYYLKDMLRGDFGVSLAMQPQRPVVDMVSEKLPITLQLNVFSLFIILPFATLFGVTTALKKNTLYDHIMNVLIVIAISVPSFVFASLMKYTLAFKLGWFPIVLDKSTVLTLKKFHSMILPIIALSLGSIASLTRYVRAELAESMNADYMQLAKAKGLNKYQAIFRHAMRNSFIPLANMVIPLFMGILGGSLVIENIFAIPGTGPLLVSSIFTQDYPVSMAVLLFYSIISLVTILVVDLSYGVIDPRIRMGGKR